MDSKQADLNDALIFYQHLKEWSSFKHIFDTIIQEFGINEDNENMVKREYTPFKVHIEELVETAIQMRESGLKTTDPRYPDAILINMLIWLGSYKGTTKTEVIQYIDQLLLDQQAIGCDTDEKLLELRGVLQVTNKLNDQ